MAKSPVFLARAVSLLPLFLAVAPMAHAGDIDVVLIKESEQHYQAAHDAMSNGDVQTGRDEMEISVEKAEKGNMPAAGLGPLYYHFGSYLELTLEWNLAQRAFANAVRNGELAHADPKDMVNSYYEYGRTSGIICQYDLAEHNLKKAYEIDNQQSGPIASDLFELALMYKAAGRSQDSMADFALAKQLMDKSNAENNSPGQYAEFLTAYAAELEMSGQHDKAAALKQQADALTGSNTVQGNTGLTPYGSECGTASGTHPSGSH
jgi:tetratricopeptide (TPR) repeat protein